MSTVMLKLQDPIEIPGHALMATHRWGGFLLDESEARKAPHGARCVHGKVVGSKCDACHATCSALDGRLRDVFHRELMGSLSAIPDGPETMTGITIREASAGRRSPPYGISEAISETKSLATRLRTLEAAYQQSLKETAEAKRQAEAHKGRVVALERDLSTVRVANDPAFGALVTRLMGDGLHVYDDVMARIDALLAAERDLPMVAPAWLPKNLGQAGTVRYVTHSEHARGPDGKPVSRLSEPKRPDNSLYVLDEDLLCGDA